MAWVARMTNQPLAAVVASPGAEFAALLDEAKSADNSPLHEILRVQCDLLHMIIRFIAGGQGVKVDPWRYPRPGDEGQVQEAHAQRVSPLDFARQLTGGK